MRWAISRDFMAVFLKYYYKTKSIQVSTVKSRVLTSPLEAHAGIFRLLMKGILDAYILWPFDKKFIFELVMRVNTRYFTVCVYLCKNVALCIVLCVINHKKLCFYSVFLHNYVVVLCTLSSYTISLQLTWLPCNFCAKCLILSPYIFNYKRRILGQPEVQIL